MGFIKHKCSYPGCGQRARENDLPGEKGRCDRHGKWYVCREHYSDYYTSRCPACYWESPEIQDGLEAARRNAAVDAETGSRLQEYIAGFRAQGYGEVAATAMAQKKFSQDPDPQPRRWSWQDVWNERKMAQVDQEWRAGKRLRCPVCKVIASASDGILLQHVARTRSGKNDGDEYCDNWGVPGEPWEIHD